MTSPETLTGIRWGDALLAEFAQAAELMRAHNPEAELEACRQATQAVDAYVEAEGLRRYFVMDALAVEQDRLAELGSLTLHTLFARERYSQAVNAQSTARRALGQAIEDNFLGAIVQVRAREEDSYPITAIGQRSRSGYDERKIDHVAEARGRVSLLAGQDCLQLTLWPVSFHDKMIRGIDRFNVSMITPLGKPRVSVELLQKRK